MSASEPAQSDYDSATMASMQIVIMTHDNDLYMKVITNDKLSLLSNVYNVGSPGTLWQFIDFSRLTVWQISNTRMHLSTNANNFDAVTK